MNVLKDVSYGNHERQRVDIYFPDEAVCKSGVILYIHGGGWTSCDKSVHHSDCEHFCALGYICATMNYRYIDKNICIEDELDDITEAVGKVKEKCIEAGFDTDKILLSGGSAGGHLALMYAYTRINEAPLTPVCVCAYCPALKLETKNFLMGISGEFEEWKYSILSAACGVEVNRKTLLCKEQQTALRKISPMTYVNENCVPTAVFHGVKDDIVPFEHAVEFINKLNENGIPNDFIVYENSGHAQDKDPEKVKEAKEIIKKYAEKYFCDLK